MEKIVYIAKGDEIPKGYITEEKDGFKFDSLGRVAEKDGRNYKLIGKKIIELSFSLRLARILASLTAIIFSLGLAYLSKDVRKFLFRASISQRLAQETSEAPMNKKEFFILRAREKIISKVLESFKEAKGYRLVKTSFELDKVSFEIRLEGEKKTKCFEELEKNGLFFDELKNYSIEALRNKKIICYINFKLVDRKEHLHIYMLSRIICNIGSGITKKITLF